MLGSGNFYWSYTEEPHATRRKEILEKHPEIKQCFGVDLSFKFVVISMVIFQSLMAYLLKDSDWFLVIFQAYVVSGTIGHALTLAIHECSHNLGFGYNSRNSALSNRLLGFFANLPCGVPFSISFKKYHLEHHRYLGENNIDTDVPTDFETTFFTWRIGKLIWILLQPIFYAFRPFILYKKSVTDMEIANLLIQFSYDLVIYNLLGGKSFFYLFGGFLLGLGLHPSAAHFISDHYMFTLKQETFSYYGPLNYVTFNVGYHVEHHDFPYVSGKNLPRIKNMAIEFYKNMEVHESWIFLMYDFVMNPNISLCARTKRNIAPPEAKSFYGQGPLSSSFIFCTVIKLFGLFSGIDNKKGKKN